MTKRILSIFFYAMLLPAAFGQAEWVDLLQDDSLALWKPGLSKAKVHAPEIGNLWTLEDGLLHRDKKAIGHGDRLVTKKAYFNFELRFDFRISHNGNSGVKYRTIQEQHRPRVPGH